MQLFFRLCRITEIVILLAGMKILILCVLALFVGIAAQAQSTTANLNIILTDVQSVKFGSVSQQDLAPELQQRSSANTLLVLSHSTSQVKRIDSKSAEYEKLYKELSSKLGSAAAYAGMSQAVKGSKQKGTTFSHIVYQVDPR
jgi:hypothetical protein